MYVKICGTTTAQDAALAVDAGADALGFIFARSPRRVTAQQAAAMPTPAHVQRVGIFVDPTLDEVLSTVATAGLHAVQLHGARDPHRHEAQCALARRLRPLLPAATAELPTLIGVLHLPAEPGPIPAGPVYAGPAQANPNQTNPAPASLSQPSPRTNSGTAPESASGRELEAEPAAELNPELEAAFLADLRLAAELYDAVLLDSRTANASGGTGRTFDWAAAQRALAHAATPIPRLIVAGGLHPENVAEAIRLFQPWGVDVVSGVEAAPGQKHPEKVVVFLSAVRSLEAPSNQHLVSSTYQAAPIKPKPS